MDVSFAGDLLKALKLAENDRKIHDVWDKEVFPYRDMGGLEKRNPNLGFRWLDSQITGTVGNLEDVRFCVNRFFHLN